MSLEKPRYLKEAYPQFDIGLYSYGAVQIAGFGEGTKCKIGNYCSFAVDTLILLGGNHRTDWVTTYPFSKIWPQAEHIEGHPRSNGDVVIGSDVWIGARAIILSGVTVGHGAVIGANSVVVSNVEAYEIVTGNPAGPPIKFPKSEEQAQRRRYRFKPGIVEELLEIAWWDWPEDRIVRALPTLLSDNINTFIYAVKEGRL